MENDKITEIRNANNIVDVISSYLPLVKKGKNFFGVRTAAMPPQRSYPWCLSVS